MLGRRGSSAMPGPGSGSGSCIKAGAVLGGDGFGYLSRPARPRAAFRTSGGCIIGGRRGDRLQHLRRPGQHRRHGHRPAAPRSTTWSRSATTSGSASAACSWPAWASPGARGSGDDVILAGHVGVDGPSRRSATEPGSRPRAACSATCPAALDYGGHPARPHRAVAARPGRALPAGADRRGAGSARAANGATRCLDERSRATPSVAGHRTPHRRDDDRHLRRRGAAGSGIVFRRVDLPARPEIPARLVEGAQSTERRTALGEGDAHDPHRRAPARRGGGAPARRPRRRARRARAADPRRIVPARTSTPLPEAGIGGAGGRAAWSTGSRRRSSLTEGDATYVVAPRRRSGSRPRSSGPIR